MVRKYLKGEGEVDYDYKYDILFFKTKNREYVKSIELDNIIIDVDSEGFLVGIQILEASKFLSTNKIALMKVTQWHYKADFEKGKIEIRLEFKIQMRNQIIVKNPIIIQPVKTHLPSSKLECVA